MNLEIAEIMDFGYPQNLSPEILKLYITQEGVRSPFSSKVWGIWFYVFHYICFPEDLECFGIHPGLAYFILLFSVYVSLN